MTDRLLGRTRMRQAVADRNVGLLRLVGNEQMDPNRCQGNDLARQSGRPLRTDSSLQQRVGWNLLLMAAGYYEVYAVFPGADGGT